MFPGDVHEQWRLSVESQLGSIQTWFARSKDSIFSDFPKTRPALAVPALAAAPVHGRAATTSEAAPKAVARKPAANSSHSASERRMEALEGGRADLARLNREGFGNSGGFRAFQLEAVEAVLAGRDVFAILATGGGKSLIYQLAAVARPDSGAVTVVLMPLLSLMEDQQNFLLSRGVAVASLGGGEGGEADSDVLEKLRTSTRPSVLFVTPEKLVGSDYVRRTLGELYRLEKVKLFVFDEAHCVSQWGHDFRDAYLQVGPLVRREFANVSILALTATATTAVRTDVKRQLCMREPVGEFVGSVDRKNLVFSVEKSGKHSLGTVLNLLQNELKNQSVIIYQNSKRGCEEIAKYLKKAGVKAECYHAGLSGKKRETNQKKFMKNTVHVMVATVAFGMGINHSHVKAVIHLSMPTTLEQYYQEAGRAARAANLQGKCLLFYDYSDKILADFRNSRNPGNTLKMLAYCEDRFTCRRVLIAEHFGEKNITRCGDCDNCTAGRKYKLLDVTETATRVIEFLARAQNSSLTLNQLRDALRGLSVPKKPEIATIPGFGSLKTCSTDLLRFLVISEWLRDEVKEIGRGIFGYVKIGNCAKRGTLRMRVEDGGTEAPSAKRPHIGEENDSEFINLDLLD